MIHSRRHRLITVTIALFSLLFMQLAVARYVCPSGGAGAATTATATASPMPCAASMVMAMPLDEAQPALCHAHCQADAQSQDKYEVPAPVAICAMPANFTLALSMPVLSGVALQAPHLMHATAPPVAIRNCCFRI